MTAECKSCKARMWPAERSNRHIKSEELWVFHDCCGKGSISLEPLRDPPPELRQLLEGDSPEAKHFRTNIIYYNNSLTFTSCRYGKDDRVEALHDGIKHFSIRGEVYHLTGPLEPQATGKLPSFAQSYFYDPQCVIDDLIAAEEDRNILRRDLLIRLRQMLHDIPNPFIEIYKTARECLNDGSTDPRSIVLNPQMKLILQDGFNKQRTNIPTSNEAAILIPTERDDAHSRDICLARRDTEGKTVFYDRVDKTHAAYMPLHYVLFFPTGQSGWHYSLEREDAHGRKRARISPRAFARYHLYERPDIFNPILAGTRLGQQYVVDKWASIDQFQLDFIRNHQKELKVDLHQGVADARANDIDLNDIGKKIILPSSYMGSDRQMHMSFQDSMAIVRFMGKATFFITFTANPSWQEIIDYLSGRSSSDRPDLIVRVFNLEREELMLDLRTVFGKYKGKVWTL